MRIKLVFVEGRRGRGMATEKKETICLIHIQYLYNTYTIHIQHIHNTCAMHMQYLYNTHTIHKQYIYNTYTVHIQYIYNKSICHTCSFIITKVSIAVISWLNLLISLPVGVLSNHPIVECSTLSAILSCNSRAAFKLHKKTHKWKSVKVRKEVNKETWYRLRGFRFFIFNKYFSAALLTLFNLRTYVPYDCFISDFKNRGKKHEHDCSDVQCEVSFPRVRSCFYGGHPICKGKVLKKPMVDTV